MEVKRGHAYHMKCQHAKHTIKKFLCNISTFFLDMVEFHVCNPNIWKVKARGSEVQDHSQLSLAPTAWARDFRGKR